MEKDLMKEFVDRAYEEGEAEDIEYDVSFESTFFATFKDFLKKKDCISINGSQRLMSRWKYQFSCDH